MGLLPPNRAYCCKGSLSLLGEQNISLPATHEEPSPYTLSLVCSHRSPSMAPMSTGSALAGHNCQLETCDSILVDSANVLLLPSSPCTSSPIMHRGTRATERSRIWRGLRRGFSTCHERLVMLVSLLVAGVALLDPLVLPTRSYHGPNQDFALLSFAPYSSRTRTYQLANRSAYHPVTGTH